MSVPVGETVSRAWKFSGRRMVPLLGLGWLPATFYGVAAAYFLGKLSATMLVWPRPDAGSFDNFALFYLFCLVVLTAFANAVMGAAMTREAIETGGEWKTAYFSVARREWALFANLLLLYAAVIGLVAAIVFAGQVGTAVLLPMIGNGGVWKGIALAPVMRGTFAVVAAAVGLFLATRFGFFLAPIAVADPPARLLQAWITSRGKFWRLLTLSLGLLVPVIIAAVLAIWAALGSQFTDAIIALAGSAHDNSPLFHAIRDNGGAIAAILAVALLIWNAIFAGASAAAYSRVEQGHGAHSVSVSVAGPALAMAAASPHVAVADVRRVEPAFAIAKDMEPAANASEAKPIHPPADQPKPEEGKMEEAKPVESKATAAAHKGSEGEKPEEIEFKTVEDLPAPASVLAQPSATTEVPAAALYAHEEPLAPQEPLPAMDPMGHAAPAAPDPSDTPPATPLPSFVKAQSSQEHEPSEAA